MNKTKLYSELRTKYPEFHYRSFRISEDATKISLDYDFEIPGLAEFHPHLEILKKTLHWKSIDDPLVENLAFHIGLVELVSYWKISCAPRVVIQCGQLDQTQIAWWKKLYFYGLGELFYTNGIKNTVDDFMMITCASDAPEFEFSPSHDSSNGYLVLIGGGKDSIVTLETLDVEPKRDFCLIVNPKPTTRRCAELAGFDDSHVIEVHRTIDSRLLELNQQGLINGHTPFSTMLASVSYLIAYLVGLKEVVVSNESSANESNVACAKINHQYSKSFEFEQDFTNYAEKYLKAPVKYFSFLRPLNELQIAKVFARLKKYHHVFKSCNVGSKGSEWVWCGHCAKCLFAYIILSPFLYPKELIDIFGQDLYENPDLTQTLLELTGHSETKPFDCVGTFAEVNYALSLTIRNLTESGQNLPYLLDLYRTKFGLVDLSNDLTEEYNDENNLTAAQNQLLQTEVFVMIKNLVAALTNRKILILGFGREGQSTYHFLRTYLPNQPLWIADQRADFWQGDDPNVTIIAGERYLDSLADYDLIIKSPGISLVQIETRQFAQRITSQLELLLEYFDLFTIGITGTKGKSTTSSLLYQILQDQSIPSLLLGNIGTPVFDHLDELKSDMAVVLEMSSHQLEFMHRSPRVAAILNIFEEHLDHYASFEKYAEAKCNIFRHQNSDDYFFYNYDNPTLREFVGQPVSQTFRISFDDRQPSEIYFRDGAIYFGKKKLFSADSPRFLLGNHNLQNIMFVLGITKVLKLNLDQARATIANFQTLHHRLEFVHEVNGVKYYDNSIGTVPAATIAALEALGDVDTLIIGGMDRGIDYTEFADYLNHDSVRNVICMPETGLRIATRLDSSKVHSAETLEDAVALAASLTAPGKSCLLSPTAASYGVFRNFEEKGDYYQRLVLSLMK